MKKRSRIALLTALLTIVFAAGIGVYSNYIGMQIYQESSNHLLESYAQISKTFTLFVQRNWVVLSQWDSLMKNVQEDADVDSIWSDAQSNKLSWHYSDFYLFNECTQYLTVDGRKGSADSIDGVFQEMYSKGEPIVSTYTATYGVPKIVFAMPMSRSLTLDGVTYYNDSIASSPTRTIAGLRSFNQKIILIAGGYDKKIPYEPLAPEILAHVKTLVLMGATGPRIEAAVRGCAGFDESALTILHADSMQHAVELARGAAQPGDVVSLSPASASFDLYPNFEVRGRDYKNIVNNLK